MYLEEIAQTNSNNILRHSFIFSPNRFKRIKEPVHFEYLYKLVKLPKDSINVKKNKGYYKYIEIGDINNGTGTIEYKNVRSIDISSDSVYQLSKDDIVISTVRTYLGGVGIITQDNCVSTKALIPIRQKNGNIPIYYILGILKSQFFIEQVGTILNASMYPRMDKDCFNQLIIPLSKDKKIIKLISFMTQNIIDKENKIKEKNNEINQIIKDELESHSHPHLNNPYSNEILENNFRFDSGLYSKEYKSIQESIMSYDGGYFDLLDEYNSKRGQNLQISNIGLSIYTEEKKENFYRLITNVEFTEDRTISAFRYLGNKKKLTLIPKNCIMLSADGSVGRCIYVDDLGKTITNIHPWILTQKKDETPIYQNVYTAMFLGYLRTVGFYEKIQDKSNGGGIKAPHLQNWIKIPKFPDSLQKDIAIRYHNKLEKNTNLSLENYLEKEKERNVILGISQLNMEVFELKDKIEELVSKIVYDEEVIISDYI